MSGESVITVEYVGCLGPRGPLSWIGSTKRPRESGRREKSCGERPGRRDAKEVVMNLFTSIGKGVVSLALWLAFLLSPYMILAGLVGVNPWLAMGIIVFLAYGAPTYWRLNEKIKRVR